jgi:hypothetical protein
MFRWYGFWLIGYAVMPEHVHLPGAPGPAAFQTWDSMVASISGFLFD